MYQGISWEYFWDIPIMIKKPILYIKISDNPPFHVRIIYLFQINNGEILEIYFKYSFLEWITFILLVSN
jgi:hypothetical protein